MAVAAILANEMEISSGSALVERMETARARIEERFLEGGAALLSVLDVLNKLIGSLDQLTGSLDEETANATMAELQQTVGRLSELSGIETERQTRFVDISGAERNLRPHVATMLETMRYLRTFAVTAKITGAGIADFAGFAEEILDRIQAGTRQVNEFGDKLNHLGDGLGSVMQRGQATISRYDETIPGIVSDLSTGGVEISGQRKILVERAAQVRKIAGGIQNKLASTLSAMQIGDITRQRIEHCQSSLTLLDTYIDGEAASLSASDRGSLSAIITNLVALQLGQSIDDFERDTAKIVETVVSFRSDLAKIDDLRRQMGGGEGDNAMRRLEGSVGAAREAVRDVEAVAAEAGEMSRSTAATVQELIDRIGVIQLVRTDIHYMALNTNLRCGKIGEHGKALNVVTAELRNFAAVLDETAEKVLVELKTLEKASEKLESLQDGAGEERLDTRLASAMQKISDVGDRMEAETEALSEQSRAATEQMNASLSRLDFKAELGEVLRACAQDIARETQAFDDIDTSATLEPALAELGSRIARLYTMVSERELHAAVLGTAPPVETAAVATVMSDDDIDDALF
ncbi:methyl-accepting chemotaxis sensory transducer [Neorhizobium sp. NCHU2750]|nr:methyl-accepting chemotaxis sensory transducer [Neorhizobium sp. NCHU2750]